MKILKRILTLMLVITMIATICVFSTISSSAQGTGTGLSEWALNAYYSGWSYVYGGCSAGAVDCSGLIYSYVQCERCGDPQLYASPESGSLSSLPNIHGLGLWQPGHVGIYVGSGMAVDARNEDAGVCYESVYSHGWTYWFKINGVSYPTNGWEECNGDYFYYEDGEYITDTSRTIDGTTYYFGSDGASSTTPGDTSAKADSNDDSDNDSDTQTSSSSLKLGSTGSRVEELQQRLYDLGYYTGAIDGDFGSGTEKAFKLFQKAAGLTVDGVAGSDIDILFSESAPVYDDGFATTGSNENEVEVQNDEDQAEETVEETEEATEEVKEETSSYSKGDYDEAIARIQERLIQLGYFNGESDGSYGTDTENAIKAFQKANGLEETGIADIDTQKLLFSTDAIFQNNKITSTTIKETTEAVKTKVQPKTTAKVEKDQVSTEIALQTNQLSSKALSNIANKIGLGTNKDGNNFGFLFWLLVMVVLLTVALIVVYVIEKKKMREIPSRHDIKKFK